MIDELGAYKTIGQSRLVDEVISKILRAYRGVHSLFVCSTSSCQTGG